MLLETARESLAFFGRATVIKRRCISSTIGILLFLVSAQQAYRLEAEEIGDKFNMPPTRGL
jgi:hypothetical protein